MSPPRKTSGTHHARPSPDGGEPHAETCFEKSWPPHFVTPCVQDRTRTAWQDGSRPTSAALLTCVCGKCLRGLDPPRHSSQLAADGPGCGGAFQHGLGHDVE